MTLARILSNSTRFGETRLSVTKIAARMKTVVMIVVGLSPPTKAVRNPIQASSASPMTAPAHRRSQSDKCFLTSEPSKNPSDTARNVISRTNRGPMVNRENTRAMSGFKSLTHPATADIVKEESTATSAAIGEEKEDG